MTNEIGMHSGAMIELTDIDPRAVCIEDIAHNLANLCRFTGGTNRFYSVAEHSHLVAAILKENGCETATVLHGLLHDATEAYLGDVSSPLKALLPAYQALERNAERVIFEALGVRPVSPSLVYEADKMAFVIETNALQGRGLPMDQNEWVLKVPAGARVGNYELSREFWKHALIRNFYDLKGKL